jgi:hypothetical protein
LAGVSGIPSAGVIIFGVLGATVEVEDGAGSVAVTRAEVVVEPVAAITSAVGSHPLEVLEVTVVAVGIRLSAPAVPLPN